MKWGKPEFPLKSGARPSFSIIIQYRTGVLARARRQVNKSRYNVKGGSQISLFADGYVTDPKVYTRKTTELLKHFQKSVRIQD